MKTKRGMSTGGKEREMKGIRGDTAKKEGETPHIYSHSAQLESLGFTRVG